MTITSKIPTYEYRANYAKVFGPKPLVQEVEDYCQDENCTCDGFCTGMCKGKCFYCGVTTNNPCDSRPPDVCEQAASIFYGDPCK